MNEFVDVKCSLIITFICNKQPMYFKVSRIFKKAVFIICFTPKNKLLNFWIKPVLNTYERIKQTRRTTTSILDHSRLPVNVVHIYHCRPPIRPSSALKVQQRPLSLISDDTVSLRKIDTSANTPPVRPRSSRLAEAREKALRREKAPSSDSDDDSGSDSSTN